MVDISWSIFSQCNGACEYNISITIVLFVVPEDCVYINDMQIGEFWQRTGRGTAETRQRCGSPPAGGRCGKKEDARRADEEVSCHIIHDGKQ